MRVIDPGGATWEVRRRWLPRYEGRGLRERWRQRQRRVERRAKRRAKRGGDDGGRWYDVLDLPFAVADGPIAFVGVVAVVAVLVVLVVLGLPLLLAVVDLVLVAAAAVAGVVGRVLFRRPWTIEAATEDGRRLERRVVGWRAGHEAIGELADQVRHGHGTAPPGG